MRTIGSVVAVSLAAIFLMPFGSQAQAPQRAEGYPGVAPGAGNVPPRAMAAKAGKTAKVTWPGFQMRPDGASRIFVQTTGGTPAPEAQSDAKRYVLVFRNAAIHLRNNRRPLETRFFNTPVLRAQLERRGRDVALVVELRAPVTPTVRSEPGENGFAYVMLEFAPGTYIETERIKPKSPPSEPSSAAAPATRPTPRRRANVRGRARASGAAQRGTIRGAAQAGGSVSFGF